MANLLHIDQLNVFYHLRGEKVTALNNLALDLKSGEICAILGKTGSGKSTLFNTILGSLSSNAEIGPEATIFLNGHDLLNSSFQIHRHLRGTTISSMPQNPLLALNPTVTCGRQVSEIISGSAEEKKKKVLQLFDRVKIANGSQLYSAFPHQVSLGQLQRISLAIALAIDPVLILVDEPFASLDPDNVMALSTLLSGLRSEGKSILMITHDLKSTETLSDRWIWLDKGEIAGSGTGSIFDSKSQLAEPIATVVAAYRNLRKRAKPIGNREDQPPLISLHNISYRYRNRNSFDVRAGKDHFALSNIYLNIYPGEILGIVGPSGSGKSTLAKIIGGLINDFEGSRTLHSNDTYYSAVQYIMQDASTALPPLRKVEKILGDILRVHRPALTSDVRKKHIVDALNDVGLPQSYLSKSRYQLSGGEKQRVILARAIMVEPQLLVMDESLSALDRDIQLDILELLQVLVLKYKVSLILVSHDHELIDKYCQRLVFLKSGGLVTLGDLHHKTNF